MPKTRFTMLMIMLLSIATVAHASEPSSAEMDEDSVPTAKRTTLGLYVTARQAYEKWKKSPNSVHVLDVRTPGEYVFVGHAEMARNIPLMFLENRWDARRKSPVLAMNAHFMERVKQYYKPSDTILIMCRSGHRSKMAVNRLAQEGYKHVYNIIDGMEGDSVKDPDSTMFGKRAKNGWKNSGAAWTYKLNPELMYFEAQTVPPKPEAYSERK